MSSPSCPSTQFYHTSSYIAEIWSWFGIATLVVFFRLVLRFTQVGLRGLKGDDYLSIAVWLCLVGKSNALTLVYLYGSNIDYDAMAAARLSECQLERVVKGSKMELLAWYTYCGIIWGLKGIVLFMFHRLTFNLDRPRYFRFVAIITALTALAMFLSLTLVCLPYRLNWQVLPPPPFKCSLRMENVYVSTILNVATDILILTIPLPVLWTMKVSLGRKIGLVLLLCSGIFVVSAALVRFGFTIVGSTSVNLNRWCQRETTVGIIAVNAPILRSLFKRKRQQRALPADTATLWPSSTSCGSPAVPKLLLPEVSTTEASTTTSSRTPRTRLVGVRPGPGELERGKVVYKVAATQTEE